MADNSLESPSFGNFSIENTMDMGMGNAQLLNDLLGPETTTSNPDDIEPIIKDITDPPASTAKPKVKEITPALEDENGVPIVNPLADFLEGNSDDDDEPIVPAKPAVKPEGDTSDDDVPETSQFGALTNDLFKLGVFTKDEGEEDVNIATGEEFLERFNAEKKKGAIEVVNNFIGQFGEDYQNAFDAIYVKGVNPKEYFAVYNKVVNFTELDLTDENNQVSIIKQALTDQGFEPEDVITEVERLRNYGDLESVAGKHHKVLVKKEAAKLVQLEQQATKDLEQKSLYKNQYINNVQSILQEKLKTKEFDGIPINPKLANELHDFLLVDKYKTASGENLTDFDRTILELKRPENHANKVKFALLLKLLEKDPTLSTIQRTGISKKTDQLFGEVVRQKTSTKTNNTSSQSNSWNSLTN